MNGTVLVNKPKKTIIRRIDRVIDKKPNIPVILGFYIARDSFLVEPSAKYLNSPKTGKRWLEISMSDEYNDYAKGVFSREKDRFFAERPILKFDEEFEGEQIGGMESVLHSNFITLSLIGWTWFWKAYRLNMYEPVNARMILGEYCTEFLEKRATDAFFDAYTPIVQHHLDKKEMDVAEIDTDYVNERVTGQLKQSIKRGKYKSSFSDLLLSYSTFDEKKSTFYFETDLARTETFLKRKLFLFAWTVLKDLNAKPIESLTELKAVAPIGEKEICLTVPRIAFVNWYSDQKLKGKTDLHQFKVNDMIEFFNNPNFTIEYD